MAPTTPSYGAWTTALAALADERSDATRARSELEAVLESHTFLGPLGAEHEGDARARLAPRLAAAALN